MSPCRIAPGWARQALGARLGGRRSLHLLERNARVMGRTWWIPLSGLAEPVFYLLSIGVGLGKLVGPIALGHRTVPYSLFVAPGLLASSAMNGAVYESTFNAFGKLHQSRVYHAILVTPITAADLALGEIATALARGFLSAVAFVVLMAALGDVGSAWMALALPAALLIGFAFAAVGMAATTFMRGWSDADMVQLVLLPLFLFSTTFYPLSTYPRWLGIFVELTPLYQGVSLVRALNLGAITPGLAGAAAYLLVLGVVGLQVTAMRMGRRLLP